MGLPVFASDGGSNQVVEVLGRGEIQLESRLALASRELAFSVGKRQHRASHFGHIEFDAEFDVFDEVLGYGIHFAKIFYVAQNGEQVNPCFRDIVHNFLLYRSTSAGAHDTLRKPTTRPLDK